MHHNTNVAKLLANENIETRTGNYSTASFDVKNRVMYLPNWKDMSKSVYDLLVGHEVGHSLWTPPEGWHDAVSTFSCPKAYVNVIEDCRIERKIKNKYPGLSVSFTKGYSELYRDGFFGDFDIQDLDIIDRINLKSKIGAFLDVPFFDDIELDFYARSMKTKTFDEVVTLSIEIAEYQKQLNQEDKLNEPETKDQFEDSSDTDNSESYEDSDSSYSEEDAEESEEQDSRFDRQEDGEELTSLTDEAFKKSEEDLISDEVNPQLIINGDINKKALNNLICSYARLEKERYSMLKYDQTKESFDMACEEFTDYMKQVKKNSYYAVKEFELHKAAYRYSRAQVSRKGTINVNKLYNYKLSDQIFNEVTNLADAKDHGMVLLLDLSGSMHPSIPSVIDQLIHLISFCKQVNIPFQVFGFARSYRYETPLQANLMDQDMNMTDCNLVELCSSDLSKARYEESIKWLYARKMSYSIGLNHDELLTQYEHFGTTPLVQSLVAMKHIINKFKSKHNCQSQHFVLLTDGDANNFDIVHDNNLNNNRVDSSKRPSYSKGLTLILDKTKIKISSKGKLATIDILNYYRKCGIKVQGFFIANTASDIKHKAYDISYETSDYNVDGIRKSIRTQINKNRCAHFTDILGYDDFYMIRSKDTEIEDEELDITDTTSRSSIAKAFKKHAKNKKASKVLLTNFGKSVAI